MGRFLHARHSSRLCRAGSVPSQSGRPDTMWANIVWEASTPMQTAEAPPSAVQIGRQAAIRFIILIGTVSLFSDMTYEGARSIAGPYLGVLGGSAAVVGIVAGTGELFGYSVRFFSGWISDRTHRYWAITLIGYAVNLFAVPALALAQNWQAAAVLLIAERMGRGIRSPVRDAMLSHAAKHTGLGWGFGLHEALDQTGAVIGPLLVAGALYSHTSYPEAFAILIVPAVTAMSLLLLARALFPRPRDFDLTPPALETGGFRRAYWLYLIAMALIGAGFVDFALIGYHFGHTGLLRPPLIPIAFAVAMGADALAALGLGVLFDRFGMRIVLAGAIVGAIAPALVFLGGTTAAFIGMALWGVGMGAQESVMRAGVARMAPPDRRGTAFGLINGAFGVTWFLGSVALGFLYDYSVLAVVIVSIGLQASALPFFALLLKDQDAPPGSAQGATP